ncbi:MAG: hypothetical protein A3J67_00295 [Parcubacteria group bacterium RIFCSPHIGHO2_02_FULL_48_10b]|nr:MAG: hypothetical protein A3J67_00295 [Parcubacteria group bacterium RIFCSPHIGHO2_02_FULL_48_10b]
MHWLIVVVLASIILIPLLTLWGCYNGLVARQNKARQALSGIYVQLKRRADLIPNLVEVVKGYAQYERSTLEQITQLRRTLLATSETDALALQQVAQGMNRAFGRIFAIAEAYPDLKASQHYLKLQEELSETEDQIAAARRIYNANVTDYNVITEQFPSNVVARRYNFAPFTLFEEDAAANQVPNVSGI